MADEQLYEFERWAYGSWCAPPGRGVLEHCRGRQMAIHIPESHYHFAKLHMITKKTKTHKQMHQAIRVQSIQADKGFLLTKKDTFLHTDMYI